jgi:hypothetical protein
VATLEEIVIKLTAETSQLRAEMAGAAKLVKDNTDKMDSAIGNFSKNGSKDVGFFQGAMASMAGVVGGNLITGAISKVGDAVREMTMLFVDGVAEAAQIEQAMQRLGNSLKLSGNYSKEAAEELENYSDKMEILSGVSQGELLQNLSKLSSITGLNADDLQRAQTAAIDLSAALGKDLSATTDMVAKAIQGNGMAFEKYKISMDLSTDSASNLEKITKRVNEQFGGSAQANINSYNGQLANMKDSFGDIFKEVGNSVVKNQVFVDAMKIASDKFKEFGDYIMTITPELTRILQILFGVLTGVMTVLLTALSGAVAIIKSLWNIIETAVTAITGVFYKLYEVISGVDGGAFDEMKKNWGEIASAFTDDNWATSLAVGFGDMTVSAFEGGAAVAETGNKIAETGRKAVEAKNAINDWAHSLAEAGANTLQNEFSAEDTALKDKLDLDLITQQEYYEALAVLKEEQHLAELEQLDSSTVDGATRKAAELELERLHMAEMSKISVDAQKYTNAETKKEQDKAKKDKEKIYSDTWGSLLSLATSGNKELAAIGKAAAIYDATINGYKAINAALGSAPPPLNFAMAAVVGAATAANVAKIAGVQGFAKGTDSVPFSAGGGNLGDNFPAMLKAGERVVPTETNQDLKAFLDNQKSQSNVSINVNVMPNTGLNNEQVGNLIEQLNNYFTSGGLKLIGAT